MDVKYIGKNAKGQVQLSRKSAMEEKRSGNKPKKPEPKQEMSAEEVDVIAQAIEGIKDL
jgi:hypothetical protein